MAKPKPPPPPVILACAPSSCPQSSTTTVTATGTGFVPGSTIKWDGQAVPTTPINATTVQFVTTLALTAVAGSHTLTLTNPKSGSRPEVTSMPFVYDVVGRKPLTGTLDIYGGYTELPVTGGGTGYFRVAKSGTRWVFVTPLGNTFWMRAVQTIPLDDVADVNGVVQRTVLISKYSTGIAPDYQFNWYNQMAIRLKAWGFNTIGEYVPTTMQPTTVDAGEWPGDHTIPTKMPFYQLFDNKVGRVVGQNTLGAGTQCVKSFGTGVKRSKGQISTLAGGILEGADMTDPDFNTIVDDLFHNYVGCSRPDTAVNNAYFMGFMSDDADDSGITRAGQDYQTIRSGLLETPPGSGGLHFGWVTLIAAPRQVACLASKNGGTNIDRLYPVSPTFYAKQALADWVQGLRDARTSVTATRSGSTVTYTKTAHGFIANERITASGFSDSSFNTVAGTGAVITAVTANTFTVTLAGAGASATGGTVAAGPGYASIGALNTAWGSSYGSFGTAGTLVTGEAGFTGAIDGVNKTFTKTLAHVPSPLSVQVVVDGVIVAGDDASGPTLVSSPTNAGSFVVGATGASTIDYSTGAVSIVLTVAPTVSISVNYVFGGWGAGSGLLDEDGSGAGLPASGITLAGITASLKRDLDEFLVYLVKEYHRVIRLAIDTWRPGRLFFGVTGYGGFGAPSRKQVYQGAAPYLDVIGLQGIPNPAADVQARVDFIIASCLPYDRPFINWDEVTAQTDSPWFTLLPPGSVGVFPDQSTQDARGGVWRNHVKDLLTMRGTVDGVAHFVGFQWWNAYDQRNEQTTFGFLTNRDNPYDAVADRVATGTDQWGYAIGGEIGNFGDVLNPMILANASVITVLGA